MDRIESDWLDYSWSVLNDADHRAECVRAGGRGIDDDELRWPGYLGENYSRGRLMLVANIHRNFDSGGAKVSGLARRLVENANQWKGGRSEKSDARYLAELRECYVQGLQLWDVGRRFRKFVENHVGMDLTHVAYLNVAKCQSTKGTCHRLQHLCLERFRLLDLVENLQPRLVLTCSTVVRDGPDLGVPQKWFHQLYGTDEPRNKFDEWAPALAARLKAEAERG